MTFALHEVSRNCWHLTVSTPSCAAREIHAGTLRKEREGVRVRSNPGNEMVGSYENKLGAVTHAGCGAGFMHNPQGRFHLVSHGPEALTIWLGCERKKCVTFAEPIIILSSEVSLPGDR